MNKFLVNDEKEFVALFKDFELYVAEDFLGVQFAYTNGVFSDDDEACEHELLDVSREVYRKHEEANFPEEYPCLVLLANDKSFDRTGSIGFKMLDFVYLKDFKS